MSQSPTSSSLPKPRLPVAMLPAAPPASPARDDGSSQPGRALSGVLSRTYSDLALMISYAQQAEDVVLRRALSGVRKGFYVDVGAGSPQVNSVTKYFYERGWRGINVEPQPLLYKALVASRPRDVNLPVAIGREPGQTELSVYPDVWGWATTDETVRLTHLRAGIRAQQITVPVRTLDDILESHAVGPIDFLKIDVEGSERAVLESVDLDRWQPTVVVVEATKPGSSEASHMQWDDLVMAAGYTFGLFDGLNRFYARDDVTLQRLAAPANTFDRYIPFEYWRLLSPQIREEIRVRNNLGDEFLSEDL